MNQFDAPIAALRSEIATERSAIERDTQFLKERERAVEAKEQALAVLERYRNNAPETVQTSAHHVHPGTAAEEIDLSELAADDSTRRRTFVDDVHDVVRRFGRQEFTNAHVEAAMKRLGIEIVGKTPRSRISLAFAKLVEDHVLVRTFIGGGNVPHRYRVRSSMSEDEVARYDAMNSESTEKDAGQSDQDGGQATPSSAENVVRLA